MIKPNFYTLRVTMRTEMLGSQPAAEDLHTMFIQSKAPSSNLSSAESNGRTVITTEDGTKPTDLESLMIKNALRNANQQGERDVDLRGRTIFLRDENNRPVLMEYVMRGFLKSAWRACKAIDGSTSAKHKKGIVEIERYLFFHGTEGHKDTRYIVLKNSSARSKDADIDWLERPLRANTREGERVALISSEIIRDVYFDCRVENIAPNIITQEWLEEMFWYGKYIGIGQWRNAGYGRFDFRLMPLDRTELS